MAKFERIVRLTMDEVKERLAREGSRTDWARVDAMTPEELEAAIASDPDEAAVPDGGLIWAVSAGPDGRRLVTFALGEEAIGFLAEQAHAGEVVEEALRLLRGRQAAEPGAPGPEQAAPRAAE